MNAWGTRSAPTPHRGNVSPTGRKEPGPLPSLNHRLRLGPALPPFHRQNLLKSCVSAELFSKLNLISNDMEGAGI